MPRLYGCNPRRYVASREVQRRVMLTVPVHVSVSTHSSSSSSATRWASPPGHSVVEAVRIEPDPRPERDRRPLGQALRGVEEIDGKLRRSGFRQGYGQLRRAG